MKYSAYELKSKVEYDFRQMEAEEYVDYWKDAIIKIQGRQFKVIN